MDLRAGIDVGLAAALLAGLLSLLSPCAVMLLPAFLSYVFDATGRLLRHTAVFYAGLVTTLVPLGVLAGGLGSFLAEERTAIAHVTGAALVALGLWQALGLPLPGRASAPARGTSAASTYLLGTTYGLAGACSGPLLGSVLAYAAFGSGPAYGGLLMVVYALGMTIPLLILAGLWSAVPRTRDLVRPRSVRLWRWRTTWTQLVSGLLTVAIGLLLILTDGLTTLGGLGSVDLTYRWEQSAGRLADRLPDLVVLGGLLLLVSVVAGVRMWSRSDRDR